MEFVFIIVGIIIGVIFGFLIMKGKYGELLVKTYRSTQGV